MYGTHCGAIVLFLPKAKIWCWEKTYLPATNKHFLEEKDFNEDFNEQTRQDKLLANTTRHPFRIYDILTLINIKTFNIFFRKIYKETYTLHQKIKHVAVNSRNTSVDDSTDDSIIKRQNVFMRHKHCSISR